MQKAIVIIYALLLSLSVSAGEPAMGLSDKPMTQIGGGRVIGTARIVGTGPRATIISCDKSTKTCMYILKKATDNDPGLDQCSIMQSWPVPPAAQQQLDQNYPYAFSFDTPVLTFYPAIDISIGCPNSQGDIQVSLTTEASFQLP